MTMLESISVTVAIISLLVSLVAARIAKSSLVQARLVSDRDRRDWRQRKWFDLYFKANEAYDSLERFQGRYDSTRDESGEFKADFNAVTSQIRSVHAAAVVFPKDPALDELFSQPRYSRLAMRFFEGETAEDFQRRRGDSEESASRR